MSPLSLQKRSRSTWPRCSRSKQPLVKTIFLPVRRWRASRISRRCWSTILWPRLAEFVHQVADDLVPADGGGAELLDLQAAGDVGQVDGLQRAGPGRPGHAQHRQDRIAGAGVVVDVAGAAGGVFDGVAADQEGTLLVEGDDDVVELEVRQEAAGFSAIASRPSTALADGLEQFGAVGSDERGAAVAAVVVDGGRVDQHGDVRGTSVGRQTLHEGGRDDALVVVLDQDHVEGVRLDGSEDRLVQTSEHVVRQRAGGFLVDPEQLLAVAALGQADDACLAGGGPTGDLLDASRIDAEAGHHRQDLLGRPRRSRAAPKRATRAAPRAARLAATLPAPPSRCSRLTTRSTGHGRFRADPLGIAVEVAVQHEVADQQDPLPAEPIEYLQQPVFHALTPQEPGLRRNRKGYYPSDGNGVKWGMRSGGASANQWRHAARCRGPEAQNRSQVPLIRWAIRAVMARAPASLHCIPGPLSRWATNCLQVDSIMPEPIT